MILFPSDIYPEVELLDHLVVLLLIFFFFLKFLAALGLHCCVRAFSSCSEYCGAQASHCGGFSCCRAQAPGAQASVVAAHGLSSCGSWEIGRASCRERV